MWRHAAVVISTAQLLSTKPELRFCAGLNFALVFCLRSAMVRISDNGPDWKWGSTPVIVNHSAKAIIIIIIIVIITTVLIRCTSGCTSVILIKTHRTSDVCLQKGTQRTKHSKNFGKQVFWKSRHELWNIPLEKFRLEFCYFIYNKLI